METYFLIGVSFLTSTFTGIIGIGGGLMLISVMPGLLPAAAIVPVHGAVQSFSNGWRVWLLRENMQWPIILRFGIPMPLGIAAGLWLFQEMPKEWVQVLIGGFILLTLFSHSLKSLRDRELPLWLFIPSGFVVGALNIIVGVVGPVLSTFLVGRNLSRQSMVVTISVFSLMGHISKVIGFVIIGFSFAEYGFTIVAMIPPIVLGTYLGRCFLGRISDILFKKVLRVVLAGLAAKLIVWNGILIGVR